MLYSCQIKSCPQAFVFIRVLSLRVGDCVLGKRWGPKRDKERLAMKRLALQILSTLGCDQTGIDGV